MDKSKTKKKSVLFSNTVNVRNNYHTRKNNGSVNRTVYNYKGLTKNNEGYSMTNRRHIPTVSASFAVLGDRKTGIKTGTTLSYTNTYASPSGKNSSKARQNVREMKKLFGNKYADALYHLGLAREEIKPIVNQQTRKYKEDKHLLEEKYNKLYAKQIAELTKAQANFSDNLDKAYKNGQIGLDEVKEKKKVLNERVEEANLELRSQLKKQFAKNMEPVQAKFNSLNTYTSEVIQSHFDQVQ